MVSTLSNQVLTHAARAASGGEGLWLDQVSNLAQIKNRYLLSGAKAFTRENCQNFEQIDKLFGAYRPYLFKNLS